MKYYRKQARKIATVPQTRKDTHFRVPCYFCQSFYDKRMFLTEVEVIRCGNDTDHQVHIGTPLIRVPGVYDVGIWPGVRIGNTVCLTQMLGKFPDNYPGKWVEFKS